MSSIIIPRKWERQPENLSQIDWVRADEIGVTHVVSYPIGVTSKTACLTLSPLYSGKIAATPTSALSYSANQGTSDGFSTIQNFDDINGATKLSHYILGYSMATTDALIGKWSSAAAYGGFLTTFTSDQITTVIAQATGSETWRAQKTNNAVAGIIRYGHTWNGGNNVKNYIKGRPSVGSDWFTSSPTSIQTVSEKLFLCRHGTGASGSGTASISLVLFGVGKGWPDEVHKELDRNPWQIFKPRREVLYFSTGSVAIPTLSSPGVTNILTTSATPQVTLTF